MKYTYNNIKLKKEPMEFNKNTKKELLQYAISGLLYMPATMIKISDNIINKTNPEFKSICIDLEDSIGDETIAEAENYLFITLNKIYEAILKKEITLNELPLIFIRVRNTKQFKKFFEENLLQKNYFQLLQDLISQNLTHQMQKIIYQPLENLKKYLKHPYILCQFLKVKLL